MTRIPTYSISALAIFAALLLPGAISAQAIVTEIMYDPKGTDSGHEWIEVYGAGGSAIPLSKWRIYENGANHNIIPSSGPTLLDPGSFAVIAQNVSDFRADNPDFAGLLFHSAFTLDNAGGEIDFKDASGTVRESASYDSSQGGLGNGNSLQRPPDDSALFAAHTPTPGSLMAQTAIPPSVKTQPAAKASSKMAAKSRSAHGESAPASAPEDTAPTIAKPLSQTASTATPSTGIVWWLALGALLLFSIAALVTASYFKKDEWDIIEESPEDV